MLWWLVDNFGIVCWALGIVALGFAAAWWITSRNKCLIGVAVPLVLIVSCWFLSLYVVTDSMLLVQSVESMRDLVNAGKIHDAIEYFDNDVTVDTSGGVIPFKKAELQELAKNNMRRYGIKQVVTNKIEVEELARPKAKVTFYIGPEDSSERGRCIMSFVLSPDGKWRVKKFTVESVIGGQKSPLVFPF
jgi:hypothetical protein